MTATFGSRAWQTPADTRLMQALVSRCWTADWPAVHLHAGDIDWWTVHAFGRLPSLEERIRLWFAGKPDATELAGFGWYGPPGDADFVVDPARRTVGLLEPMVDWVDERTIRYGATTPGRLGGLDGDAVAGPGATEPARIWAVTANVPVVDALGALGCEPGPEPGIVHFTGAIGDVLPGPAPPPGYTVATIRTEADIGGRIAVGHAAFPGSTMSVEKYRFCRTTPLYRPALDVVVRAPDDTIVAFALGWLDPLTLGVEVEPVGVHPDHHRRGLGAAACRAVLRAAGAMGATRVVIAAKEDNPAATGLYASLGLRITARVAPYRRPARD